MSMTSGDTRKPAQSGDQAIITDYQTDEKKTVSTASHTESFPAMPLFTAKISVRWRDLDAFRHVNNASYLTYLEEARLQWMSQIPALQYEQATSVMAASVLNYRRPIQWPAEIHVQLYGKHLGQTSLSIGHRLLDASDNGVLYCDGHVVMVWIDPDTGKPAPLPKLIRSNLTGHP